MRRRDSTSPTGWWLVGLLQKQSDPSVAPYWNNTILVKAKHWRAAFKKGTRSGQLDATSDKQAFRCRQRFVGVTNLVPIYEPFEDGAEMLWEELRPEDGSKRPLKVYSERAFGKIYGKPNTSDRIAHPRRVRKRSR